MEQRTNGFFYYHVTLGQHNNNNTNMYVYMFRIVTDQDMFIFDCIIYGQM